MSDHRPDDERPTLPDLKREHVAAGLFRSRRATSQAVRKLTQSGVPTNTIGVFVLDARGEPSRRVRVGTDFGALRGALIGAGVGGVVGVIIVLLAATGLLGSVAVEPLGLAGLSGALRAIAMAAAAGVPLGVLLGMGHWSGRRKIAAAEAEGGLLIVVESTSGVDAARRVFQEMSAEEPATPVK